MAKRDESYARVRQAGARLRQLRVAKQLTQQDVVFQSHGALKTTFISRIEVGAFLKPPAPDWIAYGAALDVEPNELARMYGYWDGGANRSTLDDPTVALLRSVMGRLPDDAREQLGHWVKFAVAQALSEQAQGSATRDALAAMREG